MNCYNSIRFFADVSKKLQKVYNFWQFKDHNSGRRYENKTNNPIIFICFLSPNCLGTSFLHLKIVKIHFHGVTLLSILVCKIPEFSRWKLWEKDFLPFDSGNIDIEKNEKPGFTFSIASRINSKMFRVISWSKVAV